MRRSHSLTSATLVELLIVGSIIAASWLMNTGCATVRTVADVGHDLCRVWMAEHPERATQPDGLTCDVVDVAQPFVDAISLAAAKPQPEAIKEALIAHPPLSIAAPCIDLKNPYPQHEGE